MRFIVSVIPDGTLQRATVEAKGGAIKCQATAVLQGPALAQAMVDALRVLAKKLEDGELTVHIRLDRPVELFLPLIEPPPGPAREGGGNG